MDIIYAALTSFFLFLPNGNSNYQGSFESRIDLAAKTTASLSVKSASNITSSQLLENALVSLALQDPAEQLYRIYSDSGFASTSSELQQLIERLEALFRTNPEMKTAKIRGQGDLTGEKLLTNLKAKLQELKRQEFQEAIQYVLEDFRGKLQSAYSTANSYKTGPYTLKQTSETYQRLIAEMTKLSKDLVEIFAEFPEAKNEQIDVPNQAPFGASRISAQQLLTIVDKFIEQLTAEQKQVQEKIFAGLRKDARNFETLRPLAALQVSRQQAASTNLVARRSAGDSYMGTISILRLLVDGLGKLVAQEAEFANEVLTIEGKKQSITEHVKFYQQTLTAVNAEFANYRPKWQAAITEFDQKTKALLTKLLVGDRKNVYNSRGWTSRFPGYSDNLDPNQVVNAFIKASTWQYIISITDRPTCTYTYTFQGDKLTQYDKDPAAVC